MYVDDTVHLAKQRSPSPPAGLTVQPTRSGRSLSLHRPMPFLLCCLLCVSYPDRPIWCGAVGGLGVVVVVEGEMQRDLYSEIAAPTITPLWPSAAPCVTLPCDTVPRLLFASLVRGVRLYALSEARGQANEYSCKPWNVIVCFYWTNNISHNTSPANRELGLVSAESPKIRQLFCSYLSV